MNKSDPIKYYPGIFDPFKSEDNLNEWTHMGFAELMWGLGYDMDCEHSYNDYVKICGLKLKPPADEHQRYKNSLYVLEHAPRKIVGNFLFSYYRYLTHWNFSPFSHYDSDFLHRVIIILENTYKKEG